MLAHSVNANLGFLARPNPLKNVIHIENFSLGITNYLMYLFFRRYKTRDIINIHLIQLYKSF